MTARPTPSHFWCVDCEKWTHAANLDDQADEDPICLRCGAFYQCGECGHEINWHGDCLREPGDGESPCPERRT